MTTHTLFCLAQLLNSTVKSACRWWSTPFWFALICVVAGDCTATMVHSEPPSNPDEERGDSREASQKQRRDKWDRAKAERERRLREAREKLSPEQRLLFDEVQNNARREHYALQLSLAQQACEHWEWSQAQQLLDGVQPKAGEEDLRGFEWYYLRHLLPKKTTLFEHNDRTRSLKGALSPDRKTAATFDDRNTVVLWDTATGKETAVLKEHKYHLQTMVFSPDGKTLATGYGDGNSHNGQIKLWDVASGKEKKTLEGHPDGMIWSFAYSPDGKTLASASHDKTVKLWNVETGKERFAFEGHDWVVTQVAISPNGKQGASLSDLSNQKALLIWDTE